MRKLTPMFLLASIAFGGAAYAGDDKRMERSAEAPGYTAERADTDAKPNENRTTERVGGNTKLDQGTASTDGAVSGSAAIQGDATIASDATMKTEANEDRTTVREGGNTRLDQGPAPAGTGAAASASATGSTPDAILLLEPAPAPDAVIVATPAPQPDAVIVATPAPAESQGNGGEAKGGKLKQEARNEVEKCDASLYPAGTPLPADCLTQAGTGAAAVNSTQKQSGQ